MHKTGIRFFIRDEAFDTIMKEVLKIKISFLNSILDIQHMTEGNNAMVDF